MDKAVRKGRTEGAEFILRHQILAPSDKFTVVGDWVATVEFLVELGIGFLAFRGQTFEVELDQFGDTLTVLAPDAGDDFREEGVQYGIGIAKGGHFIIQISEADGGR